MEKYISVKAVCPFYRHENRSVIYCEDVLDGSALHLAFSSPSSCMAYKKKYCKKDYSGCPVACMLEQLYDRGICAKEDILSSFF